MTTLTWFLPTFYGDIQLNARGEATTLVYEKLSPSEREAMLELRVRATSGTWGRKPWASISSFPIPDEQGSGEIELDAPIEDVQKFLSKQLKPGRVLVSAVRFSGGAVVEKTDATLAPYRKGGDTTEPPSTPAPKVVEPKPAVAATVAAPVQGCPAPDFDNADTRATRVLEAFLLDDQLEDFRRYGQFMSLGHETGHRYLVTSRQARRALERTGGRSLFDLDEPSYGNGNPIIVDDMHGHRRIVGTEEGNRYGRAFCVHDWTVPAAEEMLALHLFLTMPGRESYLRHIPEGAE